ncbi:LysM peptidoglycan-binding domain-containing protein [Dermatobacter hominis]|uniref:LysM peptidoglycan-binding domain-containing protein n=1 Tax=Dermatobacter hominis TaxID=2884263 RepID=UPI001D110239|nr:LysM peptidoglycan-binding domain-containing protein [Dermatobacter hominis]UDY36809.1 LysM peptidoglycan-binding domain-containing protein [Dermatobacter hominis]
MAAVIELRTGERVADAPRRPQLRLVQGGRPAGAPAGPAAGATARPQLAPAPAVSARTYLVRRAAVVVVAAVLLLLAVQVLAGAGRAVAGALDVAPEASGQVHVVAPGETAWDLAARYAPGIDRRAAVDDLLALNGQGPLQVGQELRLPASFD